MNESKKWNLDPESAKVAGIFVVATAYLILIFKIKSDLKEIKSLIDDESIIIDERIDSLRKYKNEFSELKLQLDNIVNESDFKDITWEEYAKFNQFHSAITNIVLKIESAINDLSNKNHDTKLEHLNTLVSEFTKKLDSIDEEHSKLKNLQGREKLFWRGKTSHLAFLFLELAEKGFIELPSTRGEASYNKLGKVLFELFEINTTVENLSKECNPNKNTLTVANRSKFTIPHLNDI